MSRLDLPAQERVETTKYPILNPATQDSTQFKLHDELYKEAKSKGPYLPLDKVTDEEKQYMLSIRPSDELSDKLNAVLGEIRKEQTDKWTDIKNVVNSQGSSPQDAIRLAVARDRVVMIGEQHTLLGTNPTRIDLANLARQVREAGVTHLAVELPQSMQGVFNEFHKRPGEPMQRILEEMKVKKQISKEDYDVLQKMITLCPDLAQLWSNFRNWGIQIACVDDTMQSTGLAREQHMANAVMDIVKENANNKVIFVAGNLHAIDTHGKAPMEDRRAAELLRDSLAQRGDSMSTFVSILGAQEGDMLSLYPLAKSLTRAVSVPTHDKAGNENAVADLNMLKIGMPGLYTQMGNFDNILLYPPARKNLSSSMRIADSPSPESDTLKVAPRVMLPLADSASPQVKNLQEPTVSGLPVLELVG